MSLPASVQTILISASTAGVVTLAVEYFAKPHLEARKERLLDMYRGRRELNAKMRILRRDLNFLWLTKDSEPFDVTAHRKLRDDAGELYRQFALVADSFPQRQRRIIDRHLSDATSDLTAFGLFRTNPELSAAYDHFQASSASDAPIGSPLEIFARTSMSSIEIASTALSLRRWRPWSYHRQCRRLGNIG